MILLISLKKILKKYKDILLIKLYYKIILFFFYIKFSFRVDKFNNYFNKSDINLAPSAPILFFLGNNFLGNIFY